MTRTNPAHEYTTERQFQTAVVTLCRYLGLKAYHTHDSRRSQPGFPDLVIVGNGVIFAELKTDRGRVRPDQQAWIEALTAAGAEAYLWRPRHLEVIRQRLHDLAGKTTEGEDS